jgi:hypothetical protein
MGAGGDAEFQSIQDYIHTGWARITAALITPLGDVKRKITAGWRRPTLAF